MVTCVEASQPLLSVAVTVYVPATNPVIVSIVSPFDHTYEKAPVPPEALAKVVPVPTPLHKTLVEETMFTLTSGLTSMEITFDSPAYKVHVEVRAHLTK